MRKKLISFSITYKKYVLSEDKNQQKQHFFDDKPQKSARISQVQHDLGDSL